MDAHNEVLPEGQTVFFANHLPAQTSKFFLCLVCAVAVAAIVQISHKKTNSLFARCYPKNQLETVHLPRPEIAKIESGGNEQLFADCYWLAFVQYMGDRKARLQDKYKYCYDYLNLVTYLDPRFVQPYWFACFAVGADQGHPELAQKLIERGIEANQDNWNLPWIAGINAYFFAHNEQLGAKYYRLAAKFPGAPDWLNRQAAILSSNVPYWVKEIRTWILIEYTSKDPLVKQAAHRNLIQLWLNVYRHAPTIIIRHMAAWRLSQLGVKVDH